MHACTVTRCTTEVSSFVRIVVVVYMYITLFTDILTFECMLGHQSPGVCEVSDSYPLYSLRYLEKHILKLPVGVCCFIQIEMVTWK